MRILIVEDQPKMASFIKKGLASQGYLVDIAINGMQSLEMVYEYVYDLVVLDINLPDIDGFTVAKKLRQQKMKFPIIMLTAQNATKDKIMGLDAGADDYLTKPFEFDELLARIRALIRRQNETIQNSQILMLKFSEIEMDLVLRKVFRQAREINLTAKEFSLLEYFLRHPGRPITRIEISEHVWDVNFDTNTNVVDVYINMLRKKIDGPFEKKLIHTKVGFGYVLMEKE